MQKHTAALSIMAAVAAIGITACGSSSSDASSPPPAANTTVIYKATLTGGAERPTANNSTATGTFTGTLDTRTLTMNYTVTFSGLVAPSTLSHIHGPGDASAAVGVLYDFSKVGTVLFAAGPTGETYSGTIVFNALTSITATVNGDSLLKLFNAGMAYVNVHSSTYPGGEIRGQIVKQ